MTLPAGDPADIPGLCLVAMEVIDKLRLRTYNPTEASRRLRGISDQLAGQPAAAELRTRLHDLADRLDVGAELAEVSELADALRRPAS